jgi:hypothetical protein
MSSSSSKVIVLKSNFLEAGGATKIFGSAMSVMLVRMRSFSYRAWRTVRSKPWKFFCCQISGIV